MASELGGKQGCQVTETKRQRGRGQPDEITLRSLVTSRTRQHFHAVGWEGVRLERIKKSGKEGRKEGLIVTAEMWVKGTNIWSSRQRSIRNQGLVWF